MGVKNVIFLFYLMYTGYTVLVCGSTNLSFLYMISGIAFLWGIYINFSLGYFLSKTKRTLEIKNNFLWFELQSAKPVYLILLGIISLTISVFTAKFYTGQNPMSIYYNLILGHSNYIIYQNYFHEANIVLLTPKKLIYILLLGIKNIIFVYSFVIIICKKKKLDVLSIFYLIVVGISHVYFGIARGTNFESYQLFLIIVYCYVMRQKIKGKKINFIFIISLGLILVGVFIKVLAARNSTPDYYITEHITYNSNEYFSSIFPTITFYAMFLYSYLGFGLYYIATLINEVWFGSIEGLISAFIPVHNYFLELLQPIKIVNKLVVIGVKWVPDAVTITSNIGVIGFLFSCFLIGYLLKKISVKKNIEDTYYLLFGYCVFVFFVSIPNGHFFGFSSEKILILYMICDYTYRLKKIKKERFNSKKMSNNK